MLTARDEEPDRVAGLEVGADDYVAKPFSPRELTARVKAVLRRAGRGAGRADDVLELGPVVLAGGAREVHVDGNEVELTQREFDLLEYLLRHAGQVVTRDQLLESVWGFQSPGETRTVEVHVAQLRKKLGHPELIRTVRGLGYKASARDPAAPRCSDTWRWRRSPPARSPFGVAVVLVRHRIADQRMSALESQANVLARVGGAPGALAPATTSTGSGPAGPSACGRGSRRPCWRRSRPRATARARSTVAGRSLLYAAQDHLQRAGGADPRAPGWRSPSGGRSWSAWCWRRLGGALLAALLSYAAGPPADPPDRRAVDAPPGALAAGEPGVDVPVRRRGRARRAGRARSTTCRSSSGRARESQRGFPGVGQPRAEDAADLDPRLRRGAGGGRGVARGGRTGHRRRGRPARAAGVRPAGPGPARARRVRGRAPSRSTWRRSARRAVERHLPRAHELGVDADQRRRPTAPGASATRTGCSRPRRT